MSRRPKISASPSARNLAWANLNLPFIKIIECRLQIKQIHKYKQYITVMLSLQMIGLVGKAALTSQTLIANILEILGLKIHEIWCTSAVGLLYRECSHEQLNLHLVHLAKTRLAFRKTFIKKINNDVTFISNFLCIQFSCWYQCLFLYQPMFMMSENSAIYVWSFGLTASLQQFLLFG